MTALEQAGVEGRSVTRSPPARTERAQSRQLPDHLRSGPPGDPHDPEYGQRDAGHGEQGDSGQEDHGTANAEGGGSNTPVSTATSISDSTPPPSAPISRPPRRHRGGLADHEAAQLAPVGAERAGDREGAAPLGQPEREHQATGRRGQHEREAELDAGEAGQVDRGQAGADPATRLRDVGDGRARPEPAADPLGDVPAVSWPPVSTRNAPTASEPVLAAT